MPICISGPAGLEAAGRGTRRRASAGILAGERSSRRGIPFCQCERGNAMSLAVVLLSGGLLLGQEADAAKNRIATRVDPRVELMSIIFRLAGNPEYNQPNSKSAYSDEVDAHFGKFRDHAVVQTARNLRRTRGVSYDAVMSMAVHISDTVTLEERIPFDKKPQRLDQRWQADQARDFLEKARDFVRESKFNQFVADHRELYTAAAARLEKRISQRDYIGWFDAFFGARAAAKFVAIPGLLNGGGSYGVGIRFPDGAEEITPVLGMHQFDDDGVPIVDENISGLVVHEFCHTYTNPLIDKHADALKKAGVRLYSHYAAVMKKQAYGNWKTMLYESLDRACTVRYHIATDGPEAGRKSALYHEARRFKWTGELSKVLAEYEANRDRYPTLDDFMPKVIAFFDQYAQKYEQRVANAPRVVSMTPKNGATDVNPRLKKIRIRFNRPMADKSWSVVGGGPNFPEIAGDISYDKHRKLLTIPVKLKPDWSYKFWLNSEKFTAFRSQDGVPLEPLEVTFATCGQ